MRGERPAVGGLGIALATVLCELLALLINIRDLLADQSRQSTWPRSAKTGPLGARSLDLGPLRMSCG